MDEQLPSAHYCPLEKQLVTGHHLYSTNFKYIRLRKWYKVVQPNKQRLVVLSHSCLRVGSMLTVRVLNLAYQRLFTFGSGRIVDIVQNHRSARDSYLSNKISESLGRVEFNLGDMRQTYIIFDLTICNNFS